MLILISIDGKNKKIKNKKKKKVKKKNYSNTISLFYNHKKLKKKKYLLGFLLGVKKKE